MDNYELIRPNDYFVCPRCGKAQGRYVAYGTHYEEFKCESCSYSIVFCQKLDSLGSLIKLRNLIPNSLSTPPWEDVDVILYEAVKELFSMGYNISDYPLGDILAILSLPRSQRSRSEYAFLSSLSQQLVFPVLHQSNFVFQRFFNNWQIPASMFKRMWSVLDWLYIAERLEHKHLPKRKYNFKLTK